MNDAISFLAFIGGLTLWSLMTWITFVFWRWLLKVNGEYESLVFIFLVWPIMLATCILYSFFNIIFALLEIPNRLKRIEDDLNKLKLKKYAKKMKLEVANRL